MTVLAATRWKSNAELIEACVELGYLHDDWWTLDPTYGRGVWWKNWQPKALTRHDITIDGVDFRDMSTFPGYDDATFDAIAYDPPYVCMGGRTTSTIDLGERYGLLEAPKSPEALQTLINDGLKEMRRLIKPKGFVLTKCQNYISSGKLWSGTYWTERKARMLGFEVFDRLEFITNPRPQPPHKRQVHAIRNLSTLLVLRAPK